MSYVRSTRAQLTLCANGDERQCLACQRRKLINIRRHVSRKAQAVIDALAPRVASTPRSQRVPRQALANEQDKRGSRHRIHHGCLTLKSFSRAVSLLRAFTKLYSPITGRVERVAAPFCGNIIALRITGIMLCASIHRLCDPCACEFTCCAAYNSWVAPYSSGLVTVGLLLYSV
jgi:hypothetical protein